MRRKKSWKKNCVSHKCVIETDVKASIQKHKQLQKNVQVWVCSCSIFEREEQAFFLQAFCGADSITVFLETFQQAAVPTAGQTKWEYNKLAGKNGM